MKESQLGFKEVIDKAFTRINQYAGANTLFYQRFSKSRAVVSTWKSGKVIPSNQDVSEFLTVSNQVIKEMQNLAEQSKLQQVKLLEEFHTLVSA